MRTISSKYELVPKMNYSIKTAKDTYVSEFLRGIAITAVIALHVLSLPHGIYTAPHTQLIAVAIDQLFRFCVPLFVAMSGYGFWMKYQYLKLDAVRFWWSQIKKLLPLYVLASAVCYVTFMLIPQWLSASVTRSFPLQLLTGQADYHLYFVPMIFQMYFLFPVIFLFVKKLPWISLLLTAVFQVWLYFQFGTATQHPFFAQHFLTDQQQYFWWFSWIFYFILGMHLPRVLAKVKKHLWLGIFVTTGVLITWISLVAECISQLHNGIDPIIVLRTTRIPVLIYSTFVLFFLFSVAKSISPQLRKWSTPFSRLGKFSYVIYLFHTLVLRFLFFAHSL